jgi:uncharacterized protein (UPF0297 family)
MVDDPLESVYSIVERTYIRLQAGDILIRCLEEKSSEPMNEMVEGLILAGPKSLTAMREILSEVMKRKTQLKDDVNQIINDLRNLMMSNGVKIGKVRGAQALLEIKPANFLKLLQQQNINDDRTQMSYLQEFQDSRELILNLNTHLIVLEEIEYYLRDWIWGMAYKQIRKGPNPAQANNPEKIL